jgi:ribonuclease P/MRP protein subunit POP7
MSAVKRVQRLLKEAEKRATAKIDLLNNKVSEKEKFERLAKGVEALKKEEVFIKATGRAIDKAMSVGKWFGEKEGHDIKVKTGSILVVDDIVEDKELREKQRRAKAQKEKVGQGEAELPNDPVTAAEDGDGKLVKATPLKPSSKKRKRGDKAAGDADLELPDSRMRWVNVVEIAVTLK